MNAVEIILAGGGLISVSVMAVVVFVLKDIFTKVGELGALKERVRTLESQVSDTKKLPEAVARLEEQVKHLINKVELLMMQLQERNNV